MELMKLPLQNGSFLDRGAEVAVELEKQDNEIIDVTLRDGDTEERRCVEEPLWPVALPLRFNERIWWRLDYSLALSRK